MSSAQTGRFVLHSMGMTFLHISPMGVDTAVQSWDSSFRGIQ